MNKDELTGKTDSVKGRVKEAAGVHLDNDELEKEGGDERAGNRPLNWEHRRLHGVSWGRHEGRPARPTDPGHPIALRPQWKGRS